MFGRATILVAMSANKRILLFVVLPLLLVFGVMIAFLSQSTSNRTASTATDDKNVPAECSPIALKSPVDVSKATGILYPGQTRGGHYKAHGGFRFDGLKNEDVTVYAPYDATVFAGSRYIERGEVQYMFDFTTDCGIEYRLDHLKTLTPVLQAVADKLPAAEVDNSRTSRINPALDVDAGQALATAVGFEKGDHGPNVSFDFGVYNRKAKNEASANESWAKLHEQEKDQAWYGVCWFDLLPATDAAIVKSLPSGDSASGKTSDYCKF